MGFAPSSMQLTSSAFSAGGAIPSKHTGEGVDVSPALSWKDIPEGTQSLAIFCHDPAAHLVSPNGTYGFVHWALFYISASATSLAEASKEYTQDKRGFGNLGYGRTCPAKGHGR